MIATAGSSSKGLESHDLNASPPSVGVNRNPVVKSWAYGFRRRFCSGPRSTGSGPSGTTHSVAIAAATSVGHNPSSATPSHNSPRAARTYRQGNGTMIGYMEPARTVMRGNERKGVVERLGSRPQPAEFDVPYTHSDDDRFSVANTENLNRGSSVNSIIRVVDPRTMAIAILETWLDRPRDLPLDVSSLGAAAPRQTVPRTQSTMQKGRFECRRRKCVVTPALPFTTKLHLTTAAARHSIARRSDPLPSLELFTLDGFSRRWDEEAIVALLYPSPKVHSIRFTPCTRHHTEDKREMQRSHRAPSGDGARSARRRRTGQEAAVKTDNPLEVPHLKSLQIRDAETAAPVFDAVTSRRFQNSNTSNYRRAAKTSAS
ncbi:hypothetical protein BKA70DRAFT_1226445 [Coprinopsis sp. MPI-PUGE-AT-0042]|nr:hypothetical protein BKA70DRAFT_1226445 [Coprinopsis sp. MPI-PUGE-AT-0042]